ncbi:hypothetical protein Y032_0071g539 [Ancylostoma ceylanicum]|uniref:GIY-YIG domain-containing protein n=1 Tax=Ancylostoma ceylanicum TaxID=53326 RepID=A0A016TW14_9BILA|nr:hypothetical protein Y032_0071g539 [Ancylostoma ceylanicum]
MTTWRPYSASDGLALVLQYLNEHLAKRVYAIVKRSRLPVRLIFRPPPTLKEILTSSRFHEDVCDEEGCRYCTDHKICNLRGAVYLIKRRGCGHRFIGESGRPLRKRLDEHRRAFERPQSYPKNSSSRHGTAVHNRDSAPEFEVVVYTVISRIPFIERSWRLVKSCGDQPEINNREELGEAVQLIA